MGVQMRVPTPRRLMLIGDRHQTRQPLQILHPSERIVHPGVTGMLMQIGHCCVDGPQMGVLHDFFADVVGERAQQRHTLGRGEHQIKTVHTGRRERAPRRAVGRDPVIEPARRGRGVRTPAVECRTVQPAARADRSLVADHQPRRYPGITFAVVLTQPTAGGLAVHRRLRGGIGGLIVVGDAPAAQPRYRQQPQPLRPQAHQSH
jgi:hypothetical protein